MKIATNAPQTADLAAAKGAAVKNAKDESAGFKDMLENALKASDESKLPDVKAKPGPARKDRAGNTNPGQDEEAGPTVNEMAAAANTQAENEAANVQPETQPAAPISVDTGSIKLVPTVIETIAPEAPAKAQAPALGANPVPNATDFVNPLQDNMPKAGDAAVPITGGGEGKNAEFRQILSDEAPAAKLVNAENPLRHIEADASASKLDGMIQKASQELGMAKAAAGQDETGEVSGTKPDQDVPKPAQAANAAVKEQQAGPEKEPAPRITNNSNTVLLKTGPEANIQKPEAPKPSLKAEKPDEAASAAQAKPAEPEIDRAERTAPPPAPRPAKEPDQIERIRAQVTENLEKGKMEFRMQLNPRDLGKIDVKMILEGGKLAIEIISASQRAAELLTKQADGLAASMRTGSMEVSTVNIVTSGENVGADMNGEYNLGNRQSGSGDGGQGSGGAKNTAGAEPEQDEEAAAPDGLLDYTV